MSTRQTRTFVSILIMFFMVLIIAGSCAMGQETVKAPIEPLYGSWVNLEYNEQVCWAKITIRPDTPFSYYGHTDITEGRNGTFNIIDCWMDSDGNKYYQMQVFAGAIGKTESHELWRINSDNTVLELLKSDWEYPTEIDSEHAHYRILYRQE